MRISAATTRSYWNRQTKLFYATSLCTLCIITAGTHLVNAEEILIGRSVSPEKQVTIDRISHDTWEELLQRYVDEQGNVDYHRWQQTPDDRKRLRAYLTLLGYADLQAKAAEEARIAYWINSYNALTIEGILRLYPTSSIRNHTPVLFGFHIWQDLKLRVGNASISLHEIENERLDSLPDPRYHFAIVCASRSCPRLRREAYEPETLNKQLTTAAKEFFRSSRNLQYDAARNEFRLSAIFKWHGEDFGSSSQQQLRAIAPYLPDEPSRRAAQRGQGRISYLDYDWSLNNQRGNQP